MSKTRLMLGTALITVAGGATPAVATINPPGLMEAVVAYDEAQVKGDKAALQRLLADDYVLIGSSGREESRDEFIADLTAPGYRLEPFRVLHPIVRTSVGGAIMGGIAMLRGQDGGKPFAACLRFVDVWSKRPQGWKVAYSQALHLESAACAAR